MGGSPISPQVHFNAHKLIIPKQPMIFVIACPFLIQMCAKIPFSTVTCISTWAFHCRTEIDLIWLRVNC